MKWKIKIINKSNLQILVVYEPQKLKVKFLGQYKPHNKEWVTFYKDKKNANDLFIDPQINYDYRSPVWKDEPLKFNIDKLKEPLACSRQGLEEWLQEHSGQQNMPTRRRGLFG